MISSHGFQHIENLRTHPGDPIIAPIAADNETRSENACRIGDERAPGHGFQAQKLTRQKPFNMSTKAAAKRRESSRSSITFLPSLRALNAES